MGEVVASEKGKSGERTFVADFSLPLLSERDLDIGSEAEAEKQGFRPQEHADPSVKGDARDASTSDVFVVKGGPADVPQSLVRRGDHDVLSPSTEAGHMETHSLFGPPVRKRGATDHEPTPQVFGLFKGELLIVPTMGLLWGFIRRA